MSEVPPPPHRRRAHTSTRDLERYAALFAERTTVMRSSAMRDLMAITARPEVISLAGGLPDTSTFPPQSFAAQMTRIAQKSAAKALQYGPTEGFEETKDCILEVMGAEGMLPDPDDVLVTTGGQQAIDLVGKTLIDPGDVVICEAPTYPGAVPVFCSYEAEVIQIPTDEEGMRVDQHPLGPHHLDDAVLGLLEALGRSVLERLGRGLLGDPGHLRGEALRREGRGVGQPTGQRDHLRPRRDRHQVAHRRGPHHPGSLREQPCVALEVAGPGVGAPPVRRRWQRLGHAGKCAGSTRTPRGG